MRSPALSELEKEASRPLLAPVAKRDSEPAATRVDGAGLEHARVAMTSIACVAGALVPLVSWTSAPLARLVGAGLACAAMAGRVLLAPRDEAQAHPLATIAPIAAAFGLAVVAGPRATRPRRRSRRSSGSRASARPRAKRRRRARRARRRP